MKKKIIGARNARTVVVNQWRPRTINKFFFVKVHVWAKNPMLIACGGLSVDVISGNEGLSLIQIKQTCDARAVSKEDEATTMYEAQKREPGH